MKVVGQMALCQFPMWKKCLSSLTNHVDELYLRYDALTGDPRILYEVEEVCKGKLKNLITSVLPWNKYNWREEMLRMLDDVKPSIVLSLDEDEEYGPGIGEEINIFYVSKHNRMMFRYQAPLPTDDGVTVYGGRPYPRSPHVKAYRWKPGISYLPYRSFANISSYTHEGSYSAETRILHYCLYNTDLREDKVWDEYAKYRWVKEQTELFKNRKEKVIKIAGKEVSYLE